MEYAIERVAAVREAATAGVPLWWVAAAAGAVVATGAYLGVGVLVVGLVKRWLGDPKYRTDSFDYLAGTLLWPGLVGAVALLLVGGCLRHTLATVARGWGLVLRLLEGTVVRLARRVGGELPDAVTAWEADLGEAPPEQLVNLPAYPGAANTPPDTGKGTAPDGGEGDRLSTGEDKARAPTPPTDRLEVDPSTLRELVNKGLVARGWYASIGCVLEAVDKAYATYSKEGSLAIGGPQWWATEVVLSLPRGWPELSHTTVFDVVERAVKEVAARPVAKTAVVPATGDKACTEETPPGAPTGVRVLCVGPTTGRNYRRMLEVLWHDMKREPQGAFWTTDERWRSLLKATESVLSMAVVPVTGPALDSAASRVADGLPPHESATERSFIKKAVARSLERLVKELEE